MWRISITGRSLAILRIVPSGDEQFIPYRVVPNGEGSELIMTNQQTAGVSNEEYAEQLTWMREELKNIKKIMEAR
ncbi:MAG: hypothetical protein WAS74_01705 [Candidatus Saccharimonas aalborgensis]